MLSKTFNQGEKGIKIKHKVTGEVFKSDNCDHFSYDADKFEELGDATHCTMEQRYILRMLMEQQGKDLIALLEKYKKNSLKDFTYQDMEKLINFLK